MDRTDMAEGVHGRLLREAVEEQRSRVATADELTSRLTTRSRSEREMLMRVPRPR